MLRQVVRRVLRLQIAIGLIGAALWLFAEGPRAGLAALAGGGISVVLSFYFALKVFARDAAADPEAALGALYRAEAMKFLLTAVLVSLAVIAFREQIVPVITTFAATLVLGYWLALRGSFD